MIRWLKRAYCRWQIRQVEQAENTFGRALSVALIRMDWDTVDDFTKCIDQCVEERAKWQRKLEACK